MSKREIEKTAKTEGLTITHYDSGHQPAMLFDTAGYWYEVDTQDRDGFKENHTGTKTEVLDSIRKHGEAYRAAQEPQ